jgi:hypothetical protein
MGKGDGLANGSCECVPDDELRAIHRPASTALTMHTVTPLAVPAATEEWRTIKITI